MSCPHIAYPRAARALVSRLAAPSAAYPARPCQRVFRRFAQTQAHAASSQPEAASPYRSYPLPTRLPSSPPRNEPVPETSIASPTPRAQEAATTRPAQQHPEPASTFASAATTATAAVPEQEAQKPKPAPPPRRKLRPRKAAITLTASAVEQLRSLLSLPEPKLIKIGVRNRGCSGLQYHLEYVDKPGAFDEEVVQDGVKVLIDSKALFSIIGSEMEWVEDKLNQRFIFHNPNIKEECGCGESFMV
ncbi:hypothetical protein GGR56DRAFT_614537 [Xylariaceae sp. FL0804]|nr:hypothetical protein GGR56DRAFT_614537 [Xylariaceae sp. FL0804]